MVCGRTDRSSGRRRRGPQARDRAREGGPARAARHHHAKTMSDTVGVIGAGRMGLPIIGHLVDKGFRTLVADIDLRRKPEVEARKAIWTNTGDLGRESDVVLVCVGFDREVRELLEDNRA
ncbi:MAG: NAD(P)-binding domain-containing protein, partial [Burkholderiales bacterium]